MIQIPLQILVMWLSLDVAFTVPSCRKRSPPHEGIVYLIAPSEWLKEEWELIPSEVPLPMTDKREDSVAGSGTASAHEESSTHTRANTTSPTLSHSSTEAGIEEIEPAEKSFSEPSSPTLSRRKTDIISFGERSRLFSHSSYDDLVSVLSDELEEAERVVPLDSPARKQKSFGLVANFSNPCVNEKPTVLSNSLPHNGSSQSHEKHPLVSVECPSSEEEAWNLDRKPPQLSFSSTVTQEPNTDLSVSDNLATDLDGEERKDQEQQLGNLLSRITGRFLQKVRSSTSESRLSASPETRASNPPTQVDSSSRRNVFQTLRTSVVNWTSSSIPSFSSSSTASAIGQSSLSEADMILEQLKKNSQTKFIYI